MARYLAHPTEDDINLVQVMRALADPVRLRLVEVLGDGAYHPCRVEEFDVPVHKSTLSHHFRILRESGITLTRLAGRNHWVRLRVETLDRRFPGLIGAVLGALRTPDPRPAPAGPVQPTGPVHPAALSRAARPASAAVRARTAAAGW